MNSRTRVIKKKSKKGLAMKKPKKSALAEQAGKLFSFQEGADVVGNQDHYVEYPQQSVIVHTFTTYSVCEEPIPNFLKR
jgi:hypothetical protein